MLGFHLLLAQLRGYWRVRAQVAAATFHVNRGAFTWRKRIGDEADSYLAISYILRTTSIDLVKALLVTALVWWADSSLTYLGPALRADSYIQLTSAIAAIGGVFIGLYYAAITAAMTAVYASMPASVSQLLLRERFGNAYMRYVATLTFTSLSLLGLQVFEIEAKTVGTVALVLGSGVAVFGFVKLGTWAFQLFNPTAVSTAVLHDIRSWFKRVVAGGYKWQDPSFQKHALEQCSSLVSPLKQLAEACQRSPHLRNDALVRLTASMLRIAHFSVTQRPHIPTKSLWFPQSYSQPDWYRSSDTQTSIAHHTGTLLPPETVPNPWWLERELEEAVLSAVRSLLDRRELTYARSLAMALESYVDVLAQHGWISEALDTILRFEDIVLPATIETVPADDPIVPRVALLDFVGRMRISCVLKTADWADTLGRDRLEDAVASADWLSATAPYSLGVHGYAVETAEWLAERLAFERLVRTEPITPNWYCSEMLALRDAEALKRAVDGLFQGSFPRIRAAVERAISGQRWWEAACLLSDGLHYLRKLEHHLFRLRRAAESVSVPRRVGFAWPDQDFAALTTSLDTEYRWVVESMANLLPRLPAKPKDLPDYRGQFLHTATERVFEYVLQGDIEALQRIFPFTFAGCLAKYDELRVEVRPTDPLAEARLALACAPVLDLIEASGYSRLLSEAFPERQTWPEIERVWQLFLAVQPDFADQLLRIISFAKQGMSIHPRSVLRANWDRDVSHKLAQIPTREGGNDRFARRTLVDHGSALIRAVVHSGPFGMMDDGSDVFAAAYLLERPNIHNDLAHPRARSLARRIADERNVPTDPGTDE